VDQFLGLLPESQIRAWLERILPSQAEQLVAEAQDYERTNPQATESKYREAIQQSPNETAARIGLARVLLRQNKLDESRRILQELASAGALGPDGEQLRAEIMLHEQSKEVGGVDRARAAAEAEPDSLTMQLNLARALAAAGRYEEALEIGLKVVQRDRRQFGEPARELMVGVFHLLGPDSELASSYRRRLALALY
jgi:putative thioredoxin